MRHADGNSDTPVGTDIGIHLAALRERPRMRANSWKMRRALTDVAMGRASADLVVRNGRWVCVQTGEIIPGTDVAVKDGQRRVRRRGCPALHRSGDNTRRSP